MKRYRVCVPDKDLKYFIDECSNGEFINVSSLRELLEKKKKTAQELMDVRKRGQGGGILLLDMAAQAEIDYCHGQIHLIEELLAELDASSVDASSTHDNRKKGLEGERK